MTFSLHRSEAAQKIQKRSSKKQNFSANHEGCQLVDSPIILKALIEGFLVRRIYVDGGSSSEVMYGHCFRDLSVETRAKLKESRTPLVGFSSEGKVEHLERPLESKSPEKVAIHKDHPDQTVTIGGNLSVKCRSGLIEILRRHADAFAWTPVDMTRIPRFIAEHELKTYPHIEPRVQRKWSIAPDRRKVVKDEVAEWLKARIVRKVNMKLNPKKFSFGMEEGKFLGYIVTSEGIRANPEKAKAVVNMPSPSNLKQMQRLSGKLVALNRFLSKAAEKALPYLETLKKCTNKKDFHWRTEAEKAFQEMKKLITELPTLTAPKKEVELMVYLSTANEAVSAVLLVERHGRQATIHYVSRTLQGAEINYPPMEKLVLALVHAARRLRRYFQGHTIKVITDKPISQILNNREATGRLAMWGIELEAYGIKYAPRSAIKGQVLADFLADTIAEDSSTQLAAVQCEGLTKGVLIEELNERSMDTTEVNAIMKSSMNLDDPIKYILTWNLPEDIAVA
ncbi:reverse transcriptase domain-containing protein [Tanacetum coccineum]